MEERNHQMLSTRTRALVDELDAGCFCFLEGLFYALYVESYVVNTAAATVLLNELGNRRVWTRSLKKCDFYFAFFEESGLNFLLGYFFDGVAFLARL